ncbi:cyclin-U2-1-like [Andrographis paniculata]|uniref:cyclin-U2-1-like n=1 Tax=Andrographis paniculata TaxID=175694 RepID=UPI0021E94298|nr:cyclin-U2-1-like [Andrographis paniculata]
MGVLISPTKLRCDLHSWSPPETPTTTPLVISVLASLIERAVARNERIAKRHRKCPPAKAAASIFDCKETPDMTVQSYLERIFRYTRAGPSVYVVAYVYIDRFRQNFPEFRIAGGNVHRLLITTIMVASKYVEDLNYPNSYFGRVGGLSAKDMNRLEMEFLFSIKFRLHVNVSVYESYCSHLEREVSFGGGYQIERALRCAEEIKTTSSYNRRISSTTARAAAVNYHRSGASLLL